MTKLEEMWAALATYQPQADAAGYGKLWAKMCSAKTAAAAADAFDAADAAAYDAFDAADADDYAAADAADAAAAAAAAAASADADTEMWAQKAIDRINKAKEIK